MSKYSWVTLTTNDTYALGALVLGNSLKRVGTLHQLSCLVTAGVSDAMKQKLKDCYNVVQEVNIMDSEDQSNLALLKRPELGITLTKLHCWRLVQFEKCVFLDADTLVLKNCDELFEREELSAAPDVSWPDCFNSGVFVFKPCLDTFGKIVQHGIEHGSFDGGDQGLLNQYFSDWAHKDITKHLPFTYNTAAYASYCYLPAFKQFKDQIKILHFAGKLKPWLVPFDSATKQAHTPSDYGHASEFLQLWWNIFCEQVHKNLNNEMATDDCQLKAGLAGALASLKLGEPRTAEQEAYEQHIRRQCWESGQIDYKGIDSFENIWKKISETIENKPTKKDDEPEPKSDKRLTSADIEDGKVEVTSTNSIITYKIIPGGYEQHIVTPQRNGTKKTEVKTFYDPKPVAADEVEDFNRKHKNMRGKTTVEVRKTATGREEIHTTTYEDGSQSVQTKTFMDGDQNVDHNNTSNKQLQSKKTTTKDDKKDQMQMQQIDRNNRQVTHNEKNTQETEEYSSVKTEEKRRVSKVIKQVSSSRTDSFDEESIHSIEEKKNLKKVKKPKSLSGPPAPPEFVDKPGEKTTVTQKKIKGGTEFIYTTLKKDGTTATSIKTVYEEEEVEMTDAEIRAYQKQLREAEKHKDVKKTTKIATKDGDKKIVPSERPGDVTTVETKKVAGATEYHYTTVTAEGLVKKSSKTVYDPVPCADGESSGEEIIEEYEEEIIEPGESTTRTVETTQKLSSREERHEIVGKKKLGQSVTVSEVTEERKEMKRRERKIKK